MCSGLTYEAHTLQMDAVQRVPPGRMQREAVGQSLGWGLSHHPSVTMKTRRGWSSGWIPSEDSSLFWKRARKMTVGQSLVICPQQMVKYITLHGPRKCV